MREECDVYEIILSRRCYDLYDFITKIIRK